MQPGSETEHLAESRCATCHLIPVSVHSKSKGESGEFSDRIEKYSAFDISEPVRAENSLFLNQLDLCREDECKKCEA